MYHQINKGFSEAEEKEKEKEKEIFYLIFCLSYHCVTILINGMTAFVAFFPQTSTLEQGSTTV
jgi:hypothetical protein